MPSLPIRLLTFGALAFALTSGASQLPFMPQGKGAGGGDPSFPPPGLMGPPTHVGNIGEEVKGMSLVDVLTVERRASLWWDYARDISSVNARLLQTGKEHTTLLVPLDSAIMKLPRKPHQGAEGDTSDSDAAANIERFLRAHLVPGSPELPTTEPVDTMLKDLKIEVVADETKPGKYRILPGDIGVVDVKEASNGRVLLLDGVLQYPPADA